METKSIAFIGKHNIDKINSLNTNEKAKRSHIEHLTEIELTHKYQVDMLNKLYMDCEFSLNSLLKKELDKKISGYKAQDIKKEIYDESLIISFLDTIEKLVSTKLRCCYCKTEVLLLYKNVREQSQWTLDRIDNNKCHSKENTVIACLKCNLQRRLINIDKFTFTKHLILKKI